MVKAYIRSISTGHVSHAQIHVRHAPTRPIPASVVKLAYFTIFNAFLNAQKKCTMIPMFAQIVSQSVPLVLPK